jgi:hypothetical protein
MKAASLCVQRGVAFKHALFESLKTGRTIFSREGALDRKGEENFYPY